jgi:hypothetical protein
MVDKKTKEAAPVGAILNLDRLAKDLTRINDAARGKFLSTEGMALAVMRNFDPFCTPTYFSVFDMLIKLDKSFGVTNKARAGGYGKVSGDRTLEDIEKRRKDRWNVLFIAGMWFQDLFNYDFRRTEQCIIPYATQEGEISFCAYNTGVGWRNIVEKMHMTATLTKWYEEHGRHEIFAGGKKVALGTNELHRIQLDGELVTNEEQHDLEKLGIARNAREEKIRARDAKLREEALKAQVEHEQLERLYHQVVLGEKQPEGNFVPLTTLTPGSKPASATGLPGTTGVSPQAADIDAAHKEEPAPAMGD